MKKTFSRFKLLRLLLTLTLLLHLQIRSQNPMSCGSKINSSVTNLSSSQPTNCSYFLNDLVPNSTDSILEVRVKLHFFTPQSSPTSGVWGGMTKIDADTILAIANRKLANIQPPTLIIPGVPFISHAKIKLVYYGTGYYKIHDSVVYSYLDNAIPSYYDNNAINVFFGACDPGTQGLGCAIDVPGVSTFENVSYIRFRSDTSLFNLTYLGQTLAHESGHVLGLNHSTLFTYTNSPPYREPSAIAPTFGCCDSVGGSDYYHENLPNRAISNNLMSQNSGAYGHPYLSPHQMAIIHYNLRTRLLRLLTPKSYQDATVADHTSDYNVTTNETWTSDRYFKGNITVKAGKTLTIKCGVAMTHGAKIIVEKTALLFIDGGTITNISGRSWDGIYIWGDPNGSQTISSGMPVNQGMVKIVVGTISHAYIGIRNHNSPNYQYGGIILAYNSHFLNNYCDIQQIGSNSNALNPSASRFYNCDFKTTSLIGDNLEPLYHVNLVKSVGVRFYGCNFEYAAGNLYPTHIGHGIYSVNSSFIVDKYVASPTVFKNLDRGVFVNNYNPLRVPVITNSEFINNLGYGAYFMNVNTLVFEKNIIRHPGFVVPWAGVYLNNCKYYTIKNNTFQEDLSYSFKSTPGLEIHNSTFGAHQVYRNIFSNLSIGINAMGDNSGSSNVIDGLKMNCNDFTQTSNIYDIALNLGSSNIAPSVMTKQGETGPNISSSNVVRNLYKATCSGTNGNKWYVHSSSTKIIGHGCNATSTNGEITKPTPQPACSRTIVNVVTLASPMNYTAVCDFTQISSGGTSTISFNRLSNMNDYLTSIGNSDHFERQATVASKLNLFLTDTLDRMDSVITLLQNNQGNMQDADIQTVFAYMAKGNYTEALVKKNALGSGRVDWKDILSELIALEQDTVQGIYKLQSDPTLRQFFVDRASSDKDGNYIAMALLKASCDSNYTEPHNYPEGSGFKMNQETTVFPQNMTDTEAYTIGIYPNPAQTGITVDYNFQNESSCKIELRDLLGKLIYTNFIYDSRGTQYIEMTDLSSGMYLMTITQNKEMIYKTKIIKKD